MLTMMCVLLLVAAGRAVPLCSTSFGHCLHKRSGSTPFADNFKYTAERRGAQCSAANYLSADSCFQDPVLRFEVTHPPEVAMTLMFRDNRQKPVRPEAHLDETHPLHGKELEVVAVGGPLTGSDKTRLACVPSDFHDKNYTGKIVLLMRGPPCVFTEKVVEAERAGAAVALSITGEVTNRLVLDLERDEGEELSSVNSSILAGTIPATGGLQLLEHLDAGGTMRGVLVVKCAPTPMNPATVALDECPTIAEANTKEVGGCAGEADEQDRLCARCQAELAVAGSGGGSAPKLCLRGNDLLPRKAATQFWSSRTLPADVGAMVYLARPPQQGCARSDYEPYAGMVVLVSQHATCSMYTAAVAARRAGVSAIIIASDSSCRDPKRFCTPKYYRVQGPSAGFDLPVHAVAWDMFPAFRAAAQQMPQTPAGDAYLLGTAKLSVGAWDEVPVVRATSTEDTVARVRPSERDFQWSATVVVCLMIIVLLLALVGASFARDQLKRHHLKGLVTSFAVPLGLASTALSVTLLVIIVLITFMLVHTAGQDSIDTAIANGRAAVTDTFSDAVVNVEEVNQRWAETLRDVVHDVTSDFFMEGVRMVTSVQLLMATYDGTWAEAELLWRPMLSISQVSKWHLAIRTREGFFFNKDYTTDARPDSERKDGLPHVSVTNNGRLYPNLHQFKYNKHVPYSYRVRTTDWWDPMQKVGGLYADAFSLVDHFVPETKNAQVWIMPRYSAKLTWPTMMPLPVSVVVPVFNSVTRRLTANVEAQVRGDELRKRLAATLEKYPNMGNVTVFVFRADGVVLSCTRGNLDQKGDRFVSDTTNSARVMFDLDSTPTVEMRAMGAHIRKAHGGGLVVSATGHGVFEQAEHYHEKYDLRVMRFHFDNGLQDSSAERRNAYVTGGNASSLVSGGAISFTGREVMYVSLQKSVNAWNVQGTKVGSNPFRSSFHLFNHTEMINGFEVVVAKDYKGIPLGPVLSPTSFHESFTLCLDVHPEASVPVSDEPNLVPNFPRLFSNALGASGTVRLFANGVFYYGLETLGCITEPTALPRGVWTNLLVTVQLDNWSFDGPIYGACSVYINGTLVSKKAISKDAFSRLPTTDFEFGRNFVGRLDNLILYNTTMTAQEAGRLHQDRRYTRSVSLRKWFYSYREVTVPGSPPLQLTAGMLLPQEDILRRFLSNNAVTRANLRVQEANMQHDLDMKVADTTFIVTAVGLASVALFLLFNKLLTSPFSDMAAMMLGAAILRVDSVPPVRSVITEMQVMEHAMRILLMNLREYKNFLPRSLLLDRDVGELSSDGSGGSGEGGGDAEKECNDLASCSSNGSLASRPSQAKACGMAIGVAASLELARALSQRRVTVAVLNVKAFHDLFEKEGANGVRQHSVWTEYMLTQFVAMRGIPEPFLGDRFTASFNGVKTTPGHQGAACFSLYNASVHFQEQGIHVSAAAVSGEMHVGNMGCPGMRKFAFISPTVSWLHTLERVACERDWSVVTDSAMRVSHSVNDLFLLRSVGAVLFKKVSASALTVYQVMGRATKVTASEWMYQLEELSVRDPFAMWNNFAEFVIRGNWSVRLPCTPCLTPTHARTHTHTHCRKRKSSSLTRQSFHTVKTFSWSSKQPFVRIATTPFSTERCSREVAHPPPQ